MSLNNCICLLCICISFIYSLFSIFLYFSLRVLSFLLFVGCWPFWSKLQTYWVWHFTPFSFFFFFKFLFIIYLLCLFLAVLGLRFCARAPSSCGEWGPLFIAVRGPVTIAASPVAEQRLQTLRLSSCGSRAQSLHGMWDPPRPGLEPASPALAGRLSTTAPPGKPQN